MMTLIDPGVQDPQTACGRTDPGDPFVPDDPFDPDDPIIGGLLPGPLLVAGLDPDLPLALFPVRLATRYHRPEPGAEPTELWIRIFPDLIHADGHVPDLTTAEEVIGHSYWERIWRAATDEASRLGAHSWIVGQVQAPRAAWIAEQTAPTNPNDAPTATTPVPELLDPAPIFPVLEPRSTSTPTHARLLPDRWCVVATEGAEYVERVWSSPVRRDIAMAPNLADLPAGGDIRDLLQAQDLWWMADFPAAEAAGMAVRLPLIPEMRSGIRTLIVYGVRGDDTTSAGELHALLDAQRYTNGVGFLPQGTPTNNTDTVVSAWAERPADLEAIFGPITAHEGEGDPKRADRARGPDRGPFDPIDPRTVGGSPSDVAVALAFGLSDPGALSAGSAADVVHPAWGRAMNKVLYPATLGGLVTNRLATDGVAPLTEGERDWLRDWFGRWVLGAGLLPTLAIGEQPYGLVPVIRRPAGSEDVEAGERGGLSSVLRDLGAAWTGSMWNAPHFSPTRSDLPPTPEEEAVRLAGVLGAVPHPTGFRLRAAVDDRTPLTDEWEAAITTLEDDLLQAGPGDLRNEYFGKSVEDDLHDGGVQAQSSALWTVRGDAVFYLDDYPDQADAIQAVIDHLDEVMIPMITAHKLRSETRTWEDRFSEATLPSVDDPSLWYLTYGDDGSSEDGTFPDLVLVGDDRAATVDRLRQLAGDAREIGFHVPIYIGPAAPMLLKLAEHAVSSAATSGADELAAGLDALADLLEAADPRTAMSDLERALRETLGLVTHRWDAWISSIANERLALMRAAHRDDVQVGGFGWLEEIVPDEGATDSHGYIHAPSLDHAATAAILRSAWLSYADDVDDAPFSIDLSSDRVRRAMWLLDGVRNGLELGELLGARFERRLHDAGLSDLIHDIRVTVADASGTSTDTAVDGALGTIVDGLALAVAYSDSTTNDPVRNAVDGLRRSLAGYPDDALLPVLEGTVDDIDATADLLTAQAVHSVAKGNLAEAASVLSLSGSGATGVADIRLPHVHRESQVVEHRVVAVMPAPDATPSAGSTKGIGLTEIAEPALVAWCESLLPAVGDVRFTVAFDDGQRWNSDLAAMGVSAVHVVSLSAVGGGLDNGHLLALVIATARFELGIADDVDGHLVPSGSPTIGAPTLSELAVAAGALRSAIGSARALRPADLVATGDVTERDVGELDARRTNLIDALAMIANHAVDDTILTDHYTDLLTIDAPGLIAALTATADRPDRLAELSVRVSRAVAVLDAPFDDDSVDDADDQIDRIVDALGLTLPVLARFVPTNLTELVESFGRSSERIGSPMRAMSWLLQAGRVHAGVGRCVQALDLVEVVNPSAGVVHRVAQLPENERSGWIAFAPATDGAKLAILSVSDAGPVIEAGPVAGLLFDSWAEPIPGAGATTGVAVHFDRPGAQPPQAVLLAMTPEGGSWSTVEVEDILTQTLELAQARAVGPEILNGWGHTLPAAYVGGGVSISERDPDQVLA